MEKVEPFQWTSAQVASEPGIKKSSQGLREDATPSVESGRQSDFANIRGGYLEQKSSIDR